MFLPLRLGRTSSDDASGESLPTDFGHRPIGVNGRPRPGPDRPVSGTAAHLLE
jgi:hypothetical protein